MVHYVDAVVVVTVMRVLFVLEVCMLREHEGAMVTTMLVCGMEEVCCSECKACDVLGMRGVGGMCEMCIYLARGILWEQEECWTCVWVAVVWVLNG